MPSRKPAPKPAAPPRLSFLAFLTAAAFCGIEPSPVVGAIVDASEGRTVSISPELSQEVFHCLPSELPTVPRRIVVVGAGGRGGKTSRLLAPKAVHAAWTVPLPTLADGETAISLLIAPKRRLARQAFAMVKGLIKRSPILAAAVVEETKSPILGITLRRPDGRCVRIEVGSADRGGQDARAYTLVFCGLDEAAFFYADDGYSATDADVFDAAFQRVVPGGQVWIVSTPWIEGVGIMESYIASDWGRHENALVAARIGTRTLNPTWDPDGTIEAGIRARPGGNEVADREILAIPLTKGTASFFDPATIKAALEREPNMAPPVSSGAGADIGHTGDPSALSVVNRYADDTFAPTVADEIQSSATQLPSATYATFAATLTRHGMKSFAADGHYKETVREAFAKASITYVERPEGNEGVTLTYLHARRVFAEARITLALLPPVSRARLAGQLVRVLSKPLEGGRLRIFVPRRKVSDVLRGTATGNHGDSVSALVLAMWRAGAGKAARAPEEEHILGACPTRSGAARHEVVAHRAKAGESPTIFDAPLSAPRRVAHHHARRR